MRQASGESSTPVTSYPIFLAAFRKAPLAHPTSRSLPLGFERPDPRQGPAVTKCQAFPDQNALFSWPQRKSPPSKYSGRIKKRYFIGGWLVDEQTIIPQFLQVKPRRIPGVESVVKRFSNRPVETRKLDRSGICSAYIIILIDIGSTYSWQIFLQDKHWISGIQKTPPYSLRAV